MSAATVEPAEVSRPVRARARGRQPASENRRKSDRGALKSPARKDGTNSAKRGNKKTAKNLPAVPYQPTENEQAAVARYEKRKKAIPVLPQMECELTQTGDKTFDAKMRMDHSHQPTAYQLIADALNTGSMPFVYGWLKEATGLGISKTGTMNMDQVNYAIAVATGIKPRDTIEAMLALQMAAVHMASMNAAATLSASSTAKGWAQYESSLNKLGRTFTTQMEALKRYRSKGSQRIVVERVNVSEGGQAIVGNVAGRGEAE